MKKLEHQGKTSSNDIPCSSSHNNMEILLAIPLVLIGFAALMVIRLQRVLLAHQANVVKAYSVVDDLYRMRHDLIPGIMTSLRAGTDDDHGLLERLSDLRARVVEDRLSRQPMKLEDELSGVLDAAMNLTETHPGLQHDSILRHTRAALLDINAQIAQARADFNRTVETMNALVARFPTAPVARLLGLEPRRPLEVVTTVKPFEPLFKPISVSFD
jgi:LemA protein